MPLPKKESLRDDLRACAERARLATFENLESLEREGKVTPRELLIQIEKRKILMGQMVGSLWPSILSSEIEKICSMLEDDADAAPED